MVLTDPPQAEIVKKHKSQHRARYFLSGAGFCCTDQMCIRDSLTLLLCMLLLTACGASAAESEGTDPETPPQESAAAPETEEPSAQQEDVTLEELLGEDYVNYLTETITKMCIRDRHSDV